MPLCKNPRCMTMLKDVQWGEGYCSKHCFTAGPDYDPEIHAGLPHPDDHDGMRAELYSNADLTDAMTQAHAIDPRLPKIIYLRRRGKTLRTIGRECGIDASTCNRILGNATPNLLRACGLRTKRA